MSRLLRLAGAVCCAGWLAGLPAAGLAEARKALTLEEAQNRAARIVPRRKDPKGWGRDVFRALERNGISASAENYCAVMAIIEQESTYAPNPEVKGLGRLAETEIEAKLAEMPLIPAAVTQGIHWFLANRPTPRKSYLSLIRAAKTERDLDLVFRNMAFYLFRDYATTGLLNTAAVARRIDAVNPVSTIGSMQVSIAFAIAEVEKAKDTRLRMNAIWKLRDELYTRAGGVNYGTRMLLGYRAGYASRLYVFADFNAGRYASRNAAFQHMVAALGGTKLALDGDLLIYDGGKPLAAASGTEKAVRALKLGLSDKEIRADLLREKEYAFRGTATYRAAAKRFAARTGKPAPYAMVPQIKLDSPKLSSNMTTERFARAVMRRYERCLDLEP